MRLPCTFLEITTYQMPTKMLETKNYIFGARIFSHLVLSQLKELNISVEGFVVDVEYDDDQKSLFSLPVIPLSNLTEQAFLFNGTVFQNKKGPKFLRNLDLKLKSNGHEFCGFKTKKYSDVKISKTA